MDQTGQLEIPGSRKNYSESLPLPHLGCGDASRTIEDGRVPRKARAPAMEIGAPLAGPEKSHGVRFVRLPCPGDSVSGVNPDFIGQKSQSLNSFVVGLGADSCGPLRLHHLWEDQKGEEQRPGQDGCKSSPPSFVYAWGRCNLFRFGFHSLPFIVINKKDRSEVIIGFEIFSETLPRAETFLAVVRYEKEVMDSLRSLSKE